MINIYVSYLYKSLFNIRLQKRERILNFYNNFVPLDNVWTDKS